MLPWGDIAGLGGRAGLVLALVGVFVHPLAAVLVFVAMFMGVTMYLVRRHERQQRWLRRHGRGAAPR